MDGKPIFLGLDLSTQQFKALVVDEQCRVLSSVAVNFANELPEFKTDNGIHRHSDGMTVTSPVHMWLKAIDLCFAKLAKSIDVSSVRAISGCGQQHGTVYWNANAQKCLSNLSSTVSSSTSDLDLANLLKDAFAMNDTPIWMDSSTTDECNTMERALGGPLRLAQITGSRAFHRFSANQIMKIIHRQKQVYQSTVRISLVSSFVASILCAQIVGIDASDGCGMNLVDVEKGIWSEQCIGAVTGSDTAEIGKLKEKLGSIIPSQSVVGQLAPYFCKRYRFSPKCEVVAFTGDNLSSLAGLCLQMDDVAISLGTSDTVFLSTPQYAPALEGHVFRNPIETNAFMGMVWLAVIIISAFAA